MPKQTFFNLPDDKREHITRTALRHFAQVGYKEASITRLVAEAGIAKGSFYQYFEDKDDLYAYLISLVGERKLAVLKREFHTLRELSLTQYLRRVSQIQLREFLEDPDMMAVSLDFGRMYSEPVVHKILEKLDIPRAIFIEYIEEEKRRGELDPNVDTQLLNFMIAALGDYMAALLMESSPDNRLNAGFIDEMINKLEYILTYGIYTGVKKHEASS